jgi:hypothetical protein
MHEFLDQLTLSTLFLPLVFDNTIKKEQYPQSKTLSLIPKKLSVYCLSILNAIWGLMLPRANEGRACHGVILKFGFRNLQNALNAVVEVFDMVIQCK